MANYLGFDPVEKDKGYYFISYNSEDADRIMPIVSELNELGVPMWYDYGLQYSEVWEKRISEKISASKAVILFFTKGIFLKEKSYVRTEYRMAAEYMDKKIYVVLLDEIKRKSVPTAMVPWWIDIQSHHNIIAANQRTDDTVREVIGAIGYRASSDKLRALTEKYEPKLPEALPEADVQPDEKPARVPVWVWAGLTVMVLGLLSFAIYSLAGGNDDKDESSGPKYTSSAIESSEDDLSADETDSVKEKVTISPEKLAALPSITITLKSNSLNADGYYYDENGDPIGTHLPIDCFEPFYDTGCSVTLELSYLLDYPRYKLAVFNKTRNYMLSEIDETYVTGILNSNNTNIKDFEQALDDGYLCYMDDTNWIVFKSQPESLTLNLSVEAVRFIVDHKNEIQFKGSGVSVNSLTFAAPAPEDESGIIIRE